MTDRQCVLTQNAFQPSHNWNDITGGYSTADTVLKDRRMKSYKLNCFWRVTLGMALLVCDLCLT